MAFITAMSPGLLWIGPVALFLGLAGLYLTRFANRETWRMTLTGLAITAVGLFPHILNSDFGAAHAADGQAGFSQTETTLLVGYGSQILR